MKKINVTESQLATSFMDVQPSQETVWNTQRVQIKVNSGSFHSLNLFYSILLRCPWIWTVNLTEILKNVLSSPCGWQWQTWLSSSCCRHHLVTAHITASRSPRAKDAQSETRRNFMQLKPTSSFLLLKASICSDSALQHWSSLMEAPWLLLCVRNRFSALSMFSWAFIFVSWLGKKPRTPARNNNFLYNLWFFS